MEEKLSDSSLLHNAAVNSWKVASKYFVELAGSAFFLGVGVVVWRYMRQINSLSGARVDAMSEAVTWVYFFLIPTIAIILLVFLWNLWLAPYRLSKEFFERELAKIRAQYQEQLKEQNVTRDTLNKDINHLVTEWEKVNERMVGFSDLLNDGASKLQSQTQQTFAASHALQNTFKTLERDLREQVRAMKHETLREAATMSKNFIESELSGIKQNFAGLDDDVTKLKANTKLD
jgi:lipopolysaccharide export LptBFGC system permease protein LptF